MPNWCSNILTIYGSPEKVEKFIKVFSEKGFESYIPMPDALKTHNTTSSEHTRLLNRLFQIDDDDLYDNFTLKIHILKEAEKILNQLDYKEREILSEIIACLKTGYYSWYEFANKNWGVKWNIDEVEILDKNKVSFETPWNAPLNFLMYVSKEDNLKFHLIARVEEEELTFEYIIEKGKIISKTKINDNNKLKEESKMGKRAEELWAMIKDVSLYLSKYGLEVIKVDERDYEILYRYQTVLIIAKVMNFNEVISGVSVIIPVVINFKKIDGETLLYMLQENKGLIFGRFFIELDKKIIGLMHNFLGDTLDPEEFYAAIVGMMGYADRVDEKLCSKTGGKRGIDLINQ